MREKLLPYLNKRVRVSATFAEQFRRRPPSYRAWMTLLTDVKVFGSLVSDHIWLDCDGLDVAGVKRGDQVRFTARVGVYVKGYLGADESGVEGFQEEDLKFDRPLDFRNAAKPEQGQATLESTLTTWKERGY